MFKLKKEKKKKKKKFVIIYNWSTFKFHFIFGCVLTIQTSKNSLTFLFFFALFKKRRKKNNLKKSTNFL